MFVPLARSLAIPAQTPKEQVWVRETILVVVGAAVMALAARCSIPTQPVPFTLQTFALMALSLSLGRRVGILTQGLYLLTGAIGLPVFSGGAFGFKALIGPTGGYLISFAIVAAWLGYVAERGWDASPWKLALALNLGIAVNLGLGWAYLSLFVGPSAAFATGVAPFVLVELAKAVAASLLLPGLVKLFRRKPQG